jgi:hypothetical protein
MFEYIEATPQINDVVVSGGDSYYLNPEHLTFIGQRLLDIPHVRRFRFATKGLAVCPMRITDTSDGWIDAFVALSDRGKEMGKQVAMHTHFNFCDPAGCSKSLPPWSNGPEPERTTARRQRQRGNHVETHTLIGRSEHPSLLCLPIRYGEGCRRYANAAVDNLGSRNADSGDDRRIHDAIIRR